MKCLEMLGSVSSFLSFIMMLKIAPNKDYFNGPCRPSCWGGAYRDRKGPAGPTVGLKEVY